MERDLLVTGLFVPIIAVALALARFLLKVPHGIVDITYTAVTAGVFIAIVAQTRSLIRQTSAALRQHYKPLAQEVYCYIEQAVYAIKRAFDILEAGEYHRLKLARIESTTLQRAVLLPGVNVKLAEKAAKLARQYNLLLKKAQQNPAKIMKTKLIDAIEELSMRLHLLKENIKYTYALQQEDTEKCLKPEVVF